MPLTPQEMVTDVELAGLVGVSSRRIRQLAENGTLERAGRGRYELGPALRALLEDAAGSGSALQRERTRKVAADATRAELELAKAMGEVAPIGQIARVWALRMTIIRQGMMTLPSRVASRLVGEKDERRVNAILRDEIVAALHQAADAEITLDDEEDAEIDPA
jgi:phage terminase Nu1 subunit (DNA packaging protein)